MVRKFNALTLILVVIIFLMLGCATSSVTKTETITTETIYSTEGNKGNFPSGQTSAVKKTTKSKETKKPSGGGGILGTTVHAIGWALALPFKLIAGLIQFIF